MFTEKNPLLNFTDLPLFADVQPAHAEPAIRTLLTEAQTALDTVTRDGFPARWEALSATLDVPVERLGRAWGVLSHLQSVADSPALRDAYNALLPDVSAFWTQMGASQPLYARYRAISADTLNPTQQKALENSLLGFRLSGAELQGEQRARYASISQRLAELSQQFSEHVLDCTDAFAHYAQQDEVAGIPQDVLDAAGAAAEADGRTGFKFTLQFPSYYPVMQYAQSSQLRETLYRAYVTRASEQSETAVQKGWDNTPLMQEILQLRQEKAQLLGFSDYAALSVAKKMAESADEVCAFLRDLAQRAMPFARKEVAALRDFARTELNLTEPQAWDWTYIAEKQKEARYSFNEQEVKQYFQAPRVLEGLFATAQQLFGIGITATDCTQRWHDTVQLFSITRNGQPIGRFYLDPSARSGKRGGAWMDDVRSRWLRPDTQQLQLPAAHMVCNFASGIGGRPPLLTHDDVITLFHEFGHALHHLLTSVDEIDVAGISGVEWDAVELPSQFMENFCWEWEAIQRMSAHVETGKPLPRELYDRMLAARNYNAGMATLRQIEFALFDMELHRTPDADVAQTLAAVRKEVAVLPTPDFNRFANSFSHIFAGGYAAGYYSYKWAEVLSADVYAAFEEDTQNLPPSGNGRMGAHYLREILSRGGSRSARENFAAFRGREPQIDALLRHQGLVSQ